MVVVASWHRRRLFALESALVGLALVAPAFLLISPATRVGAPAGFRTFVGCLALGAMVGAPIFIVARLVARVSRSGSSELLSTTAIAAMTGVVGLQVHCPITDRLHLLAHAAVPVAFLAVALTVGRLIQSAEIFDRRRQKR